MSLTLRDVRRETSRRLRHRRLQIGEDVRRMRLDANVSIRALSRATGINVAHLARVETGIAHASLEVLTAIGVALGADLSLRYFPGSGPRIHDRFQAPMVEALLRVLHPRWLVELEVPITQPARGVIDLVLHDAEARLAIASEVQSDLRRLEQQIRWGREKADGLLARFAEAASGVNPRVSQLLVLRSTVRTRELARQYEATLRAAYPARAADVVAALTTGDTTWPDAGIAWVHVHGRTASLMRRPPTGVSVGR